MLKADDGNPDTMAARHELQIRWTPPGGTELRVYPAMFPVGTGVVPVARGHRSHLPGAATVSGPGRADIRFAVDAAGELFVISKSDGMIRAVTGASA